MEKTILLSVCIDNADLLSRILIVISIAESSGDAEYLAPLRNVDVSAVERALSPSIERKAWVRAIYFGSPWIVLFFVLRRKKDAL